MIMKKSNLMKKNNMTISSSNPLVNQIDDSFLLKRKIYITYNICETCNLNCLFCCIDDLYHGKRAVSINNSDLILNKLREDYTIDTIFIMANEPTTQPELANHIIKYAIKNNIKIKVVSNGFAPISVYQKMLKDINPSGINKITISLDSMDKDIHNKIRNNNNSFSNTLNVIKYLKNNNYNLRVQMTICDINYDTILSSVRELNLDYGVNNFAFHCMSVSSRAKNNGLNHINAFKWRSLVTKLFELKNILNDILEFSVPIIALTENELKKLYFNNNIELMNNFKLRKPLGLCPAINGNNIYLKANNEDVYISRCQILFDNIKKYSYEFDYKNNMFIKNIDDTDYDAIKNSKTLCPVILTELNRDCDYEEDELGNKLYYVCRVILANPNDLDF